MKLTILALCASACVPTWASPGLNSLFDRYHEFQKALSSDNMAQAQVAAKKMTETIAGLDQKAFTGEVNNLWKKHGPSLLENLKKVQKASDIESIRKTLKPMSGVMISLADVIQPEGFQHYRCGMALNHTGGEWLQKGGQIANPYYGASMLRCGSEVKRKD